VKKPPPPNSPVCRKSCRPTGSNPTVQVVGSPVQHITSEAERTEADYIVMGSHGHTALYELLVGSTTHGVLKRAHCPVVIVPAGKASVLRVSDKESAMA
jgi:nucleotide-binding universal stress UspA family protein